MRLIELHPFWVHPNIFVFLCPHCRTALLSCKNVPMCVWDQHLIVQHAFGNRFHDLVYVPCKKNTAWKIEGQLPNITVTPSIDASASGHWHGFIKNGEIC